MAGQHFFSRWLATPFHSNPHSLIDLFDCLQVFFWQKLFPEKNGGGLFLGIFFSGKRAHSSSFFIEDRIRQQLSL